MNALLFSLLLSQTPTPILQAEPAAINRGDVKSGVILSQSFTLHHPGKGLVWITAVHASCGCVHPKLSSKSIRPASPRN